MRLLAIITRNRRYWCGISHMAQSDPKERMPQRGSYAKISFEIRQRILDAWERGDDPYAVGSANGVKRRTICDLLARGTAEVKPRGGAKGTKITPAMKTFLQDVVGKAPDSTLQELADGLEHQFHVQVTPQAVGRVLDGISYTVKQLRSEPDAMNSEEVKEKRFQYSQALLERHLGGCRFYCMDETNMNIHCKRSNGRARKGERAVARSTTSKGPNIHVVGAMSSHALVKYKVKRGAFRTADMAQWMKELVQAIPPLPSNVVIVCDNAPVHSKAEEALEAAMAELYGDNPPFQAEVLRLGPYSPMMNPIEMVWSKLKAIAKAKLRDRRLEILAGPQGNDTIVNHRLTILETVLNEALQLSFQNEDEMRAYTDHANSFVFLALDHEDMPLGQ